MSTHTHTPFAMRRDPPTFKLDTGDSPRVMSTPLAGPLSLEDKHVVFALLSLYMARTMRSQAQKTNKHRRRYSVFASSCTMQFLRLFNLSHSYAFLSGFTSMRLECFNSQSLSLTIILCLNSSKQVASTKSHSTDSARAPETRNKDCMQSAMTLSEWYNEIYHAKSRPAPRLSLCIITHQHVPNRVLLHELVAKTTYPASLLRLFSRLYFMCFW